MTVKTTAAEVYYCFVLQNNSEISFFILIKTSSEIKLFCLNLYE